MNDYKKLTLSIDIGGTKISYALIDKFGQIRSDIVKIDTKNTVEGILYDLKGIIKEFEDYVSLISIATAGAVNTENTKVISSTGNLPKGYNKIDFLRLSEKIPVFIENDANAACFAEYKIGAARGDDNTIVITLGTGVGCGVIVDGKLLKGCNGTAAEMHFSINRLNEFGFQHKRQCTCGNNDCWEIYASGNGLRLTGVDIFKKQNITTYEIIKLFNKGHDLAKKTIEIWHTDILNGLLALTNIFNPTSIIISGGMAQFVDYNFLQNRVNTLSVATDVNIKKAKFENNSGLIGAALLANRTILGNT